MSYYSSRYTSATKPIIRDARYESQYDSHYGSSRASSTDSRGSYYSSSSTDYSSRRSCGGSSEQRADDEWQRKHRVPDNKDYQITSSSSRKGKVDIVSHKAGRHDTAEPRASEATSSHYKTSQHRPSKPSEPRKH